MFLYWAPLINLTRFNFSLDNHDSRSEDLEMARQRDVACASAWVGHPNVDIVGNSPDFETKIRKLIR